MIARDWIWEVLVVVGLYLQPHKRILACQNAWRHYPGSTEPARASLDQPLQLNWCNVPESPCHWRSFGSDHWLPLLLAKSMLAN